jgi:hypothetical protein
VQALAREGVPQPPLQRGEEKMEPAPGVRGIPPTAVVIPQEEAAEPAQWQPDLGSRLPGGPEVPGARGFALAAEQQEKARYKRAYERITGLAEGIATAAGERDPLMFGLGMVPPGFKRDLETIEELRQANAKAAAEGDVKGAAMREIEGIASLVMKAPELIAGYEAESERELDFGEIAQKANEEALKLGYELPGIAAADVAAFAMDPVNHWRNNPVMDSLILMQVTPTALGLTSKGLLLASRGVGAARIKVAGGVEKVAGAVEKTKSKMLGSKRSSGVSSSGEKAIYKSMDASPDVPVADELYAQGVASARGARVVQEGAESMAKHEFQRTPEVMAELQRRGLDTKVSDAEIIDRALQLPESRGAVGGEMAKMIVEKKIPQVLDTDQTAAMVMAGMETQAEMSRLSVLINEMADLGELGPKQQGQFDTMRRQYESLKDRDLNIRLALDVAGSEQARAFRFRQVALRPATSSGELAADWVAVTGKKPVGSQAKLIDKTSTVLEESDAGLSKVRSATKAADRLADTSRARLAEIDEAIKGPDRVIEGPQRAALAKEAAELKKQVKELENVSSFGRREEARLLDQADTARKRLNRAQLRQAPIPYRLANGAVSLLMETPAGIRSAGSLIDWSMMFTQSALISAAKPQYALLSGIETMVSGTGKAGARYAGLAKSVGLPLNNRLFGLYDPKRMALYNKAGLRLREVPGIPSKFVMGEKELALGARMLEFARDIPIFGRVFAALDETLVLPAERMFAAYCNGMAIRLMDEFVGTSAKTGMPIQKIPMADMQTAAYAANVATGSGSFFGLGSPPSIPFLGPGKTSAEYAKNVAQRLMNPKQWLWSTRFTAAGFDFMTGGPQAYGVATGATRGTEFAQRLWQQQIASGMAMGGMLRASGWEVDLSPEAGSLFGKAYNPESGEVLDFMGGRIQPARFAGDMLMGGYYNINSEYKEFGADFQSSVGNRIADFARTKSRPGLTSMMLDMYNDTNAFRGEEGTFDLATNLAYQFTPMFAEQALADESATPLQRLTRAIGSRSYTMGEDIEPFYIPRVDPQTGEPIPGGSPFTYIKEEEVVQQIGDDMTQLLEGITESTIKMIQSK